jgi:hypothetical protein
MSRQKIGLTKKELELLSWYFWKDEKTPQDFIETIGTRLGYGRVFAAALLRKLHRAEDAVLREKEGLPPADRSRVIRSSVFNKCSKEWSELADAKSLSRIKNCRRASIYLSGGLWMHACGECNEQDFCSCALCAEVHTSLADRGVFND